MFPFFPFFPFFFLFLIFFGREDVVVVRPIDSYCAQNWGTVGFLSAYICVYRYPRLLNSNRFCGSYRSVLAYLCCVKLQVIDTNAK